ncbi:MAG TPA: 4-hydroxy-tetrahydrodipicolinate reductase [Nitrospiria bacterium]|nr:4-hydroxy-tetrahydrodipicolinate reductase [Nitrospiria bacterium]
MAPIPVIVMGAAGRMGSRIISLLREQKEVSLAAAIEYQSHAAIGRDAGEAAGGETLGVTITPDLPRALKHGRVIIDFTAPEVTAETAALAAKAGIPLVIGTTGLSDGHLKTVRAAADKVAVLHSPNMSIGVNLLFRLSAEAATALGPSYDIEIVEAHHRMKKDAPSGTALHLARVLADATGRKLEQAAVYTRHGSEAARQAGQIGIQSIRGGDIVGDHTVIFAGSGERLELTHRASSRDNFARGALLAATWIVDQPPGLYTMQDLLGNKGQGAGGRGQG